MRTLLTISNGKHISLSFEYLGSVLGAPTKLSSHSDIQKSEICRVLFFILLRLVVGRSVSDTRNHTVLCLCLKAVSKPCLFVCPLEDLHVFQNDRDTIWVTSHKLMLLLYRYLHIWRNHSWQFKGVIFDIGNCCLEVSIFPPFTLEVLKTISSEVNLHLRAQTKQKSLIQYNEITRKIASYFREVWMHKKKKSWKVGWCESYRTFFYLKL